MINFCTKNELLIGNTQAYQEIEGKYTFVVVRETLKYNRLKR